MRRLVLRALSVLREYRFAVAAALFFALCCIYAGFAAANALEASQNAEIARLIFCFGEASVSRAWITLIWWRLLLTIVAAVMSVWMLGSLFSLAAQTAVMTIWGLGWGSVFALLGGRSFWAVAVFILPCVVFVAWSSALAILTGRCTLLAFKLRHTPKTPVDCLWHAYPLLRHIGRGFSVSMIGVLLEMLTIYIAESILGSVV